MRITFVLPFAGLQGGVKVVAIYASRLMRMGHRVTVISTPRETTLRSTLKALALGHGKEPSHFDGVSVDHRVLDRVRDVTEAAGPDADVVVATFYTTAYGVLRLSPCKGAKAIFIQNYEVQEGKPNPRLDATWRMPMHKITISRWLVDLARGRFGDAQTSLVPNSVDMEQFHAAERSKQTAPTVGFLYSTFSLKGCRTTLSALRTVASAEPSLRLVVFGAEQPDFRMPLPANAEFHFRPEQHRIRDLYSQCDLWLCGSNVEGFHLPPLEAMACRCPVVSTRVGGPMDIVEEGVNGHLVDVKDADALADRSLRLLRLDDASWRRMSDAAHATATRFTWDDAANLFVGALEQAVERSALDGRPATFESSERGGAFVQ